MQDRYLFRAKCKYNGEWVEGCLSIDESRENEYKYRIKPIENSQLHAYPIYESTICQCTGIKDKNGNLIWENDIVSYEDTIICKQKFDRIVWNEYHAGFHREHKTKMGLQYLYMNGCLGRDCEVIGNTIDNPELLEQEE